MKSMILLMAVARITCDTLRSTKSIELSLTKAWAGCEREQRFHRPPDFAGAPDDTSWRSVLFIPDFSLEPQSPQLKAWKMTEIIAL